MSLFTNYENADAVVVKLLKYLGVHINAEAITAELDQHPNYPSLLAISDVLTNFGIQNDAYYAEAGMLEDVSCPFIAHIAGKKDFVVVQKIDAGRLTLSDDERSGYVSSIEDFGKIFMGVILSVTKPKDEKQIRASSGLANLLASWRDPIIPTGMLLVFATALIYQTDYFVSFSWQLALLTAVKTAGLATSILLLIQSISSDNPFVQRLCGDSRPNCNNILSSKAALVFPGLSWSEVGFFYFAGTWLVLLTGSGSPILLKILALLNLLSLPYTIYSIYYQARVAKQWCRLCCTVQALLWMEFLSFFLNYSSTKSTPITIPVPKESSILFICLLLPVLLWMILKPVLLKAQSVQPLKKQLRRFKYNSELFGTLLTAQSKYALPGEEWSIALGNPAADNALIIVTNPYCQPCAVVHHLLDEWLDRRDDLQVRIVFTAENNDQDIKTPVTRHFMALNEVYGRDQIKQALHDWYGQKQKSYKAWAENYPVKLNEADFYKLDRQMEWCLLAEVASTPTILLNGYRLPEFYQLKDLKYMLY